MRTNRSIDFETGTPVLKRAIRRVFFCVCLFLAACPCTAQESPYQLIYNEIVAMNKAYDSAFFLTFDIKVSYSSDTMWAGTDSADFTNSNITGTYTFHQNKALYKLDNIEYMQNDSFAIAVYNDEKFILVGRPPSNTTRKFLPLNAMLDSMLSQMQQLYYYNFSDYDSIRRIEFTAESPTDPAVVYETITVEYEPGSYHLLKIKCRVKSAEYTDVETVTIRKADLTFLFQNYRIQQVGAAVFSEDKYLLFDGPNDIKPSDPYREFIVYKNY